ncbi:hypothetical protein D9601_11150 [Sphingomonas sp. MA1305]|uniref:hypothetical protein n=1 Tax=Sphingomonas sp. MA1305 TaxID=2479204 RepID=UPI0018DFCC14|nr:hypothetical protein [Sphingomonas sp. MA1305]MBI0475908.1 hypothetical protein [Sphingomonas sp. MA1305]
MVFAIGLLTFATAASTAPQRDICDLGRAVVRDLPRPVQASSQGGVFVDDDASRPSLLTVCPELRKALPPGYTIAKQEDRERANIAVPTEGVHFLTATLYTIGIPTFAADGRSATVAWSYVCTGLCGATLVSRYVRSATGWHLDGEPQVTSVS